MRGQPALPKERQAITLAAAVGFVGRGHFSQPSIQRRQQIGLAEMLTIGQTQCTL